MSVSPTSGVNGSSSNSNNSQSGTGAAGSAVGLSQNEFLNLLVAQLKYQNPMQPMNSSTFITQLASFETVQELQSIQSSLQTLVQDQSQLLAQLKASPQTTGTGATS